MIAFLSVVAWAVCSRLSYLALKDDWLEVLDWTVEDRRFAIAFSLLGPFGLLGSMTINPGWFFRWLPRPNWIRDSDEVLEERRD